ncbi:MAG: TRAP transporter small permease subunit, partial [Tistlia sp.]
MGRAERWFVEANRAVVALALAAIFVIVFANVVLRYGFGWSLSWAEETARFLMVFGAFAGAGLALREGRLVEIDLFVALLPRRLRL